ncbi:MAG: ferredoxin [Candidatus Komeilibacteria bacterium]|nr:ferredoxin [Candidatus Komeilibacteria bacterium]
MKIKINKDKCIGCGTCAALAPNTFALSEDYKANVINQTGDNEETIWLAAKSCPTGAIELEDDNGQKLWPK